MSASIVRASLRGSEVLEDISVRQDPFYGRTATQSAVYLLVSSLAAAALNGLWHPAHRLRYHCSQDHSEF